MDITRGTREAASLCEFSSGDQVTLRFEKSAKNMKKNAKLASLQTSLKHVAIFLHNADSPNLRVTKPPPNSPTERCCFALRTGCDSFFAQRMLSVSKVGQVGFFFDLADYFNGNI